MVVSKYCQTYFQNEVKSFHEIPCEPREDHEKTQPLHALGLEIGEHLREAQSCLNGERGETKSIPIVWDGYELGKDREDSDHSGHGKQEPDYMGIDVPY